MRGQSRRRFLAGLAGTMVGAGRLRAAALGPGEHPLGLDHERDGRLYIPRGYTGDTPLPLLVFCHGAGGTSASVSYTFPLADRHGVIILAPDSRDQRTWDLVLGEYGPDADFLARAIGSVAGQCRLDRTRFMVGGHSDGASYALSFGIGAGDVFGRILAFSPGVMQPVTVAGKPRIFIAHGTADGVIPIEASSRQFVPRLTRLGYDVTYREYEGRHAAPPEVLEAGFAWAVA